MPLNFFIDNKLVLLIFNNRTAADGLEDRQGAGTQPINWATLRNEIRPKLSVKHIISGSYNTVTNRNTPCSDY